MNTSRIRLSAVLLALMSAGCDRLVNRYGRSPTKACDLGLISACRRAIAMAPTDLAKVPLRQRACDLGDAIVCSDLGAYLFEADAPRRDRARAQALWTRACARDVGLACRNLGVYAEAEQRDTVRAITYYERACQLSDGVGCRAAAILMGSSEPMTTRARFDRACALGDEIGCGRAGINRMMHEPKDFARGITLMRRGCDARDAVSCFNLGVSEREGEGVVADPDAAVRDFTQACALDHGVACTASAELRSSRARTQAERVAAITQLRRACTLGELRGCGFLGEEMLFGDLIPPEPVEGERLLRRACTGRQMLFCHAVAVYIRQGRIRGAPAEADSLLRDACAARLQRSCEALAATPAAASPAAPTPADEPPRRRRHRRRDDD